MVVVVSLAGVAESCGIAGIAPAALLSPGPAGDGVGNPLAASAGVPAAMPAPTPGRAPGNVVAEPRLESRPGVGSIPAPGNVDSTVRGFPAIRTLPGVGVAGSNRSGDETTTCTGSGRL